MISYPKTSFLLKIESVKEVKDLHNILSEVYEEETLIITAWQGNYILDKLVTEMYPELEDIGICEEFEGCMVYLGKLKKEELQNTLKNMGFIFYEDDNINLNNLKEDKMVKIKKDLKEAVKCEDYRKAALLKKAIDIMVEKAKK